MKRILLVCVILLAILSLTACAAGPNAMAKSPDTEGKVAGFWAGLWQGIVAPITFIISLFTDKVNFYEVHNNGNWYDLGFILGAGMLGGGGIFGSRKRRKDE